MGKIYIPPKVASNGYGKVMMSSKTVQDFMHLIGMKVNDIVLFDDSTDEMLDQGRVILPRHYYVFVGTKDGEVQLKSYEYDQYRIVVTTHDGGIIYAVDSIG